MTAKAGSAPRRMVGRLSAGFILQATQNAQAGAGGMDDLLDTLIVVATLQANISVIQNNLQLQATYAAADAPLPDEVRRARAVSVHAVAGSLGLPYETVRRRVGRLVKHGRLGLGEGGIWMPGTAFGTQAQLEANLANHALVRRLYRRLRELEVLPPPRRTQAFEGAAPVLIVVRRLIDYVMRSVQALGAGRIDIIAVIILLGVVRANSEHLPETPKRGATVAPRPVSALALAGQLGFPRETVRRHLVRLVETGDALRTAEGFTAAPGGAAAFLDSAENLANLRRMFGGLDELGVLAGWEAA